MYLLYVPCEISTKQEPIFQNTVVTGLTGNKIHMDSFSTLFTVLCCNLCYHNII